METAPDLSLFAKPVLNCRSSNLYTIHKAIIETDVYGPWPLLTNIKLNACDVGIIIPTMRPLFQVEPIERLCYSKEALDETLNCSFLADPDEPTGLTDKEWDGFRKTIRPLDPLPSDHTTGQYAVQVRRRPIPK